MSRHDGTSAGSKSAEEARKPFVVEVFISRSYAYKPVKGARFDTLDDAVVHVGKIRKQERFHVVEFGADGKPRIVWDS